MSQLEIYPLSEKPEFAPTCAAWSFGSWGCHIEGNSLDDAIARYKERAQNTIALPLIWIGLLNNKIIGMISLKESGHEDHKDLSPWLSAMFIHPEFRKQGHGSNLIQHLHKEAKNLGFKKLNLFTPDVEKLYEKNGWKVTGQVHDPRGIHNHETLMEIEL